MVMDAEQIAKGLTKAQRCGLEELCIVHWATAGDLGFSGSALSLLCVRSPPLAERRRRRRGQYEYRLTDLGLAVRAILQSETGE
jgi:hypothetical protein